jgi:hypothetical protein
MIELFIYYRVPAQRSQEAKRILLQWQRALNAAHPELRARLLMRPDAGEGLQTWMETYALSSTGTDAAHTALRALLEQGPAELQSCIVAGRHVEVFVPCV